MGSVSSVLTLSLLPNFALGQGGSSSFEQPRIQRGLRPAIPAVPAGPASLTGDGSSHPAIPSWPLPNLSADGQLELPRLLPSCRRAPPPLLLLGCPPCLPSLPNLPFPALRAAGRISVQPPSTHLGFSLPCRRFISPGYWLCEEGPRFSGRGLFGGPVQVGGLRARPGRLGPSLGLPHGKKIPVPLTEEEPHVSTKLMYCS